MTFTSTSPDTAKQSSADLDSSCSPQHQSNTTLTTRQIIHSIHAEKGLLGFWSGYSASLILTLNPSLTFFYFEALKRVLLTRSKRDNPPAVATFLLAATSKALASSVTYPFSLAKARMQTSGSGNNNKNTEGLPQQRTTILTTLLHLFRTNGLSSLYSGLPLELTKGFFSHGITMLIKQNIHSTILSLYLSLSHFYSSIKSSISPPPSSRRGRQRRRSNSSNKNPNTKKNKEYYDMAIDRVEAVVEKAGNVASAVGKDARGRGDELISKVSEKGTTLVQKSEDLLQDVLGLAEESLPLELLGRDYGVGED